MTIVGLLEIHTEDKITGSFFGVAEQDSSEWSFPPSAFPSFFPLPFLPSCIACIPLWVDIFGTCLSP